MENLSEKTHLSVINREIVLSELKQKDAIDIQRGLLKERRIRITVMSLLVSALVLTVIYGTMENPFQYTLSKIGNRFNNRIFFIFWAMFTGFAIQSSVVALFRLEKYNMVRSYKYIVIGTGFLILSALSPSLMELYPLWTWVHIITAGLYGVFFSLSVAPFMIWVSRENPRLQLVIKIWTIVIWAGSISWMLLLGNTGIFELWFFLSAIVFLLYLSLTLFEEQIVKTSVELLRDEQNLNLGIEKIFIDLEKEKRVRVRKARINREKKHTIKK
ncbi:MAG: hypothetical protein KJ847_02800 [Firmicutes bacterium]|nr:hypothetical protein [Bacillota bacterium]